MEEHVETLMSVDPDLLATIFMPMASQLHASSNRTGLEEEISHGFVVLVVWVANMEYGKAV